MIFFFRFKSDVRLEDMSVSKNGGTQQPWVFPVKMIILGCFGGTTIFGNTHMLRMGYSDTRIPDMFFFLVLGMPGTY